MVYLKNRIIAKEGPRIKDGILQHYNLQEAKFTEKWLTLHRHPANNQIQSHQIIGRVLNERLKNGNLIVDMDIFDDLLSDEDKIMIQNLQDVSIGYWYSFDEDIDIKMPIRKVKKINHVVIGAELGVCSYPECGLNVVAADTKETPYAIQKFELEKVVDKPNITQTTLTGCDEDKLKARIADLETKLKIAQDQVTTLESKEKEKLVDKLSKRLNISAEEIAQDSLEDLQKLDKRTEKTTVKGLVLTPDPKLSQDSEEEEKEGSDEEKGFKLTESGELPVKNPNWNKTHKDYVGANQT